MRAAYNVTTILLATDSAEVLREMAEGGARGGWRVVSLQFDVAKVEGKVGVNMGRAAAGVAKPSKPTFIEHRLRNHDPTLDRGVVVASLYAELDLLSTADMFIGTVCVCTQGRQGSLSASVGGT